MSFVIGLKLVEWHERKGGHESVDGEMAALENGTIATEIKLQIEFFMRKPSNTK